MQGMKTKLRNIAKKIKQSKLSTKLWLLVLIAVIVFVVIYLIFAFTHFIPAGEHLTRNDWLQFVGTYLSFVAATIVALVSVYQSKYHSEKENERRQKERFESIQPFFSLRIFAVIEEAFSLS